MISLIMTMDLMSTEAYCKKQISLYINVVSKANKL